MNTLAGFQDPQTTSDYWEHYVAVAQQVELAR
jgi:hypothetical protein